MTPDISRFRDLKDMPARMLGRPMDHRGFPVPWFVTERDEQGRWDFRHVTVERAQEAVRFRKCWVTGETLGRHVAFVIGPMCCVNLISGDPPVIPEIGKWSAKICPFLSQPLAKRPSIEEQHATAGVLVPDNPAICAVWVTREYHYGRDRLFHLGPPTEVTWWHKGAEVTGSEEAEALFHASVVRLGAMAAEEGPHAYAIFARKRQAAERYSPLNCAQTFGR